jgi:hypothetical protein
MPNQGELVLATAPPHTVRVRFSYWRHRISVRLDGRTLGETLRWSAPGAEWRLPLPGLPGEPLSLRVECRNERVHYPHTHVLTAEYGGSRLRIAPSGQ